MKVYTYEKLERDFHIDHYSGMGFPQDRRTLQSHPYHEFSLINAGDITYTANNCIDRVNEKCFIFSAAYQLHNPFINQNKKYERYQIMFTPDSIASVEPDFLSLFSPLMSKSAIWRVPDKVYNRMLSIMETLLEHYESAPDSKTTTLEFRILVTELMILATEVATDTSDYKRSALDTYINEVVSYIQNHYAEEITLDFLASKHFISYTKLTNDFKKHVGMTICNFITLTRIEAAKTLLQQGYSVNNVAMRVGYPGTSYFIKIFKKYTHTTPLKFQQSTANKIF